MSNSSSSLPSSSASSGIMMTRARAKSRLPLMGPSQHRYQSIRVYLSSIPRALRLVDRTPYISCGASAMSPGHSVTSWVRPTMVTLRSAWFMGLASSGTTIDSNRFLISLCGQTNPDYERLATCE